jgi:hypothetical protein
MSERDQWHEVVAYFDGSEEKVLEHKGHKTYVRGSIGDVVVAQISSKLGEGTVVQRAAMEMAKQAMSVAGVQDGLIIPDTVQFMRLKPVDEGTAAKLEKERQGSQH